MSDNSSSNKRIAKNTAYLYVRMFFVMLISLYTSRVVINVLGVSDYGINNVVAGFVSLFAFLNATLASCMSRFYNFEGGQNGEEGFKRVYSVGVRVHAVLALTVFVLLESFGIWYINNVLVVPDGRLEAANYIYQFCIISMVLVILQIPYRSAILSNERMSFYAVVDIIDVVLNLAIVLALPYIAFDKLIAFAFLQFCVKLFNYILNIAYAKINFKYLQVTKRVDRGLLKNMLSFSGWNLAGTVVFMLKGQGVNLLLNAFFGTVVNAARGVAFQINNAVTNFSASISMSFKPQMVSSYAEGNYTRAFNLFTTQSKISYGLLLMLVTPLILEIDYVLQLWLGDTIPDNTGVFASLVLVDSLVCSLNTPVTQMVMATGKIKRYQIYNSVVNIMLLPICWIFLEMGFGAWMAFVVTIFISIVNQCVCVAAMMRVIEYSYKEYLRNIILPCVLITVLMPVTPYLLTILMEDSFIRLLLISLLSPILTSIFAYIVLLNSTEKKMVTETIGKRFNFKKR